MRQQMHKLALHVRELKNQIQRFLGYLLAVVKLPRQELQVISAVGGVREAPGMLRSHFVARTVGMKTEFQLLHVDWVNELLQCESRSRGTLWRQV